MQIQAGYLKYPALPRILAKFQKSTKSPEYAALCIGGGLLKNPPRIFGKYPPPPIFVEDPEDAALCSGGGLLKDPPPDI